MRTVNLLIDRGVFSPEEVSVSPTAAWLWKDRY